jgi:riboflavin synthase
MTNAIAPIVVEILFLFFEKEKIATESGIKLLKKSIKKKRMFTGIIEATGKVEKIDKNESNIDFVLSCPLHRS